MDKGEFEIYIFKIQLTNLFTFNVKFSQFTQNPRIQLTVVVLGVQSSGFEM